MSENNPNPPPAPRLHPTPSPSFLDTFTLPPAALSVQQPTSQSASAQGHNSILGTTSLFVGRAQCQDTSRVNFIRMQEECCSKVSRQPLPSMENLAARALARSITTLSRSYRGVAISGMFGIFSIPRSMPNRRNDMAQRFQTLRNMLRGRIQQTSRRMSRLETSRRRLTIFEERPREAGFFQRVCTPAWQHNANALRLNTLHEPTEMRTNTPHAIANNISIASFPLLVLRLSLLVQEYQQLVRRLQEFFVAQRRQDRQN